MIQGVTIFRASQLRTAIETTTRTASVTAAAFGGFRTVTRSPSGQATARGRVRSTARADLPETLGHFGQGRPVRAEPDLLRRPSDLIENRLPHRGAAGSLLQSRRIGVGDSVDVVVAARGRAAGLAHRGAQAGIARELLERFADRLDFSLLDRNLEGRFVRQLRKPAD